MKLVLVLSRPESLVGITRLCKPTSHCNKSGDQVDLLEKLRPPHPVISSTRRYSV